MMSKDSGRRLSDFGPADPTDNRPLLDWSSKYPDAARHEIRVEATYLGIILLLVPPMMMFLWLRKPQTWLALTPTEYDVVLKYGLAWLAGMLGGVLFDLKWLYHSVARQSWHLDRRLWRVFTPHISGGLAFAMIALLESNLLRLFDQDLVSRSSAVVGFAFLIGYFSDSAIAKLGEIAATLFGPSRSPSDRAGRARDIEPPKAGRPDAPFKHPPDGPPSPESQ